MVFHRRPKKEEILNVADMMHTQIDADINLTGKGNYFATYNGGEELGIYPIAIIMMSGISLEDFKKIDEYIRKALKIKSAPISTLTPQD